MTTIDPLAARLAHLVKAQAGQAAGASRAGNAAASFESLLSTAIKDTVGVHQAAEATAMRGLTGQASVREVVEAVSAAEVTLQTATAVRDRVIAAYQDIIRMPI
ncbi:MAG: flagellar hook-basal body complex protein FliE [Geminicoccaceae bacterium]|nr:MAG: flagellar hook-basal body complex protein FliE [Geminicoccaceae bacterium]